MSLLLHIAPLREWEEARSIGVYTPASLRTEGFIHLSSTSQVINVANAFYRDQPNLVLLVIDSDKLTSELKWEAPAHPATTADAPPPDPRSQFPHLYGPLNMDAVVRVLDFQPGPDGTFSLPGL
jgi:uncharacterized protein (DUF952 family)